MIVIITPGFIVVTHIRAHPCMHTYTRFTLSEIEEEHTEGVIHPSVCHL